MPDTIKSVCDEFKNKLCQVPIQDFGAAATIRDVQLAFDPKGTKRLSKAEVKATRAFFDILLKIVSR